MIYGIVITIGIIAIIASRFLYCSYDITLGGSQSNNLRGGFALFFDILGTILVVWSIVNVI